MALPPTRTDCCHGHGRAGCKWMGTRRREWLTCCECAGLYSCLCNLGLCWRVAWPLYGSLTLRPHSRAEWDTVRSSTMPPASMRLCVATPPSAADGKQGVGSTVGLEAGKGLIQQPGFKLAYSGLLQNPSQQMPYNKPKPQPPQLPTRLCLHQPG